MKRALSLGLLFVVGVLGIVIFTIGFVQYLLRADQTPPLAILQATTFVLMVLAALALVVLLLGFAPHVIGRTGNPPGRLGSLSLRLSERPRLLRGLYAGLIILLVVVGSLLFGASEPGP